MTEAEARDALRDAAALWQLQPASGTGEVVSTAVDALVAGVDSPSLRELAGASASWDYWTLRPVVQSTLEELDMLCPEPDADELQVAAARVMCRRLLAGSLTARELAAWANRAIGHDGAARLLPIVELDDWYDEAEYTGVSLDELEGAARREAKSLLDGDPLPDRTSQSHLDAPAVGAGIQSRFAAVLGRVRALLSR